VKAHKNIIIPTYTYDERLKIYREAEPFPPANLFFPVGY